MAFQPPNTPQKIKNGEIHNWYRIALGYSDQLVQIILNRFQVLPDEWVLDPFCGSGTTLVECKKQGLISVGIDANPSSYFATKVKTSWDIEYIHIPELLERIQKTYRLLLETNDDFTSDPTYVYLHDTGMLERGWISPDPLKKAILIKKSINGLQGVEECKNIFLLALIDEVVFDASNVKFGPQLYCGIPKTEADVLQGFRERVLNMVRDLKLVQSRCLVRSEVIGGDSRYCGDLLREHKITPISYIICSPPYPGEHDYTRHTRLELAFLEKVRDRSSLQTIKHQMIRSNTKGIYKGDDDASLVKEHPVIRSIVNELSEKIKGKTHGFARLYPQVVQEYFGGMKRHLANLFDVLAPGAHCAYVLGDQSSYLQVYIPTAEILGSIARELNYEVEGIFPWKTAWATKTSKHVKENILIFHKG